MSKITDIEAKILQLGAGEFQKFCDTFLSLKEEYGKILCLGMKPGTQKTTIGNPDTYFRKENGRYVFVVYTTEQKDIYNKIKKDIDKCLDFSKIGIEEKDIEEIVCCHTSSNLKPGDDKNLHDFCFKKNIKLTIYGVDEIAQQIYIKYKFLAKDLLGISIDTNQIMNINEFIEQYDSNEMVAPLDTKFQFRENELKHIITGLLENKVVMVYGNAGVGKTRIVLEAVKIFCEEHKYNLLCVKNNNLSLYDDLIASIYNPGKYVFFVDDANKLNQLDQILQYLNKEKQGYDVKIIVTVRDYVKEDVLKSIIEYKTPKLVEIKVFSDDEIKSFLESNMGIINKNYVYQIINIAEGNARIAYMAGKLAKDNQNLKSIKDATQLYDTYYSKYADSVIGIDEKLSFTAGVIAIFGVILLDKLEYLNELFKIVNISKEDFEKNIRKLSVMEFVEVKLDKVVTISDQCFANYIFYYNFVKHRIIPLSKIIEIGFKYFKNSTLKSLNMLFKIFNNDEINDYIRKEINTVWDNFEKEEDKYYYDFVKTFHLFRPEEGFLLFKEKIDLIPEEEFDIKNIDFNKNIFIDYEILELLTGYRYDLKNLETVIKLLNIYISKNEKNAILGYKWFKANYGINYNSFNCNYNTENFIAEFLNKNYNSFNEMFKRFSLQYISYLLGFEFDYHEHGRKNTINMYNIHILSTPEIERYRKECWEYLERISEIDDFSISIFKVLKNYSCSINKNMDNKIIEFDKPFVLKVFENISCGNIQKLLILRDLLYTWEDLGFSIEERYKEMFNCDEWNLYKLIGDKYKYSGLDYKQYQISREKNIIEFVNKLSLNEVEQLVISINKIYIDNFKDTNEVYDMSVGVNIIVDNICNEEEKAIKFFYSYIDNKCSFKIYPQKLFVCVLKNIDNVELVYKYIKENDFKYKNNWQFAFFGAIPKEFVNSKIYNYLLEFLNDKSDEKISYSSYRSLRLLDKFKNFNNNIYVDTARIIFNKKDYSSFIVLTYFESLFNKDVYSPKELLELFQNDIQLLKDIYFYILDKGEWIDTEGIFLTAFLENNDIWLETYTKYFWSVEDICEHNILYQLNEIWKFENYKKYIDYIFYNRPIENTQYIFNIAIKLQKLLCNDSDNEIAKKQLDWIIHIIEKNAHNNNIYFIFDAIFQLSQDIKKVAIEKFLKCNSDYNVFENILIGRSFIFVMWSDSRIPIIKDEIDFLESLLTYMSGLEYLKHKKLIKKKIRNLEKEIQSEEIEDLCRSIYM